jgi:hypothetical protein
MMQKIRRRKAVNHSSAAEISGGKTATADRLL